MKLKYLFIHIILLFSVFNPTNASDARKIDKLKLVPEAVEPLIQNQWVTFAWPYNAYNPEDSGRPKWSLGKCLRTNFIRKNNALLAISGEWEKCIKFH